MTNYESLWIGLVEVTPRTGNDLPDGAAGAFVNVLSIAADASEFLEKVRQTLDALEFDVQDVENIEPFARRVSTRELDPKLILLANEVLQSGETRFGTFHCYEEKDNQ